MAIHQAAFDAGSPALNFANWAFANRANLDGAESYGDLVATALLMGLVDAEKSAQMIERAQATPSRTGEALAEARILARVIHRIFAGLAKGAEPATGDISFLNGSLGRALAHMTVVPAISRGAPQRPGAYVWAWHGNSRTEPDCMLWPVVRDAAELLVGQDPARVRLCQGADCDRLFLDISKAGRRRWCQMETCGNRAKARRYAELHSRNTGQPA